MQLSWKDTGGEEQWRARSAAMSKHDLIPDGRTAHIFSSLFVGEPLNGTRPEGIPAPWRAIVRAVAQVEGKEERAIAFAAALATLELNDREQTLVWQAIYRADPQGPRPAGGDDWWAEERADALMGRTFEPMRYPVPRLFCEGLTLFFAAAKLGKSYLLLHLSLAVSLGGYAFGTVKVEGGEVLYLSLEDPARRVAHRLHRLNQGLPAPKALTFIYEARPLEDGLLDKLDAWMARHPDTRLVIIDTFAGIRERPDKDEPLYFQDYLALKPLRTWATKWHVAVVVVHHSRKMGSEDWTFGASGSTGMLAVVDAVVKLERGRGECDAVLRVANKDLDAEVEMPFTMDTTLGTYRLLAESSLVLRSTERMAIMRALREAKGPLKGPELAERTGQEYENMRRLLSKLVAGGEVLRVKGGYTLAGKAEPGERVDDKEDDDAGLF